MITILPSTSPQSDLSKVQERFDLASEIDRIHVDFVDGVFADNTTIEPQEIVDLQTNSKLDFHLMVDKPVTWLQKCKDGGADRVISQIEMMIDVDAYMDVSKDVIGMVGLAIDVDTSVAELLDHSLERVDIMLMMSVKAGFGGQSFHPLALKKIDKIVNIREKHNYKFTIGVDGGVTTDNIKSIVDAGADEVSIGNRLFDGDLAGNIQKYLKAAYGK